MTRIPFLLGLFALFAAAACSPPPNMAVTSRSLDAGLVHQATLKGIRPIYVSRLFLGNYRSIGTDLGAAVGERLVIGEVNSSTQLQAGRSIGELAAILAEDSYIASQCQYFIQTDDPVLVRAINNQVNFRFDSALAVDRTYLAALEKDRQEIQQFIQDLNQLRNVMLAQEGVGELEEQYIIRLRELFTLRQNHLDTVRAQSQQQLREQLPGMVTLAIVNRCRDIDVGQRLNIIAYRAGFVIEPDQPHLSGPI